LQAWYSKKEASKVFELENLSSRGDAQITIAKGVLFLSSAPPRDTLSFFCFGVYFERIYNLSAKDSFQMDYAIL
jgi:hypothetical protein